MSTLNSFAQIIPSPLTLDHLLVNLASGDVVVPVECDIQEAFIVAKVQVHFPSIIQDKHFTMFERREGPSINIDVRVNFDGCDMEAAVLKDGPNRAGDDSFADPTDDTSGN